MKAVDLKRPELNGKRRLEAITTGCSRSLRVLGMVVMGPMSDPAEARLIAGVTRYFTAVAWIAADAELARRQLQGVSRRPS